MELLLLSNSTLPGKAWLEHALPLIAEQIGADVNHATRAGLLSKCDLMTLSLIHI